MLGGKTKLPAIPGLTDRPGSIKSGKPLKKRVKICYRSDLYMKEQLKVVVAFQEQLKSALDALKTSKANDLDFHRTRVQDLKVVADEMVVILQISAKINRELSYARKDLLKAVENGADSLLINRCRKRVQWLESKLEQLITKYSPYRKQESGEISAMSSPAPFSALDRASGPLRKSSSVPTGSLPPSRVQTLDNSRLDTAGTSVSNTLNVSQHWNDNIIGGSQTANRLLLHPGAGEDNHEQILEVTMEGDTISPYSKRKDSQYLKPSAVSVGEHELSILASSPADLSGLHDDDIETTSNVTDNERRLDRNKSGSRIKSSAHSAVSAVSSLFTDVTDEGTRFPGSEAKERKSVLMKPSREKPSRQLSRVQLKTPAREEIEPPRTKERRTHTAHTTLSAISDVSSVSLDFSETLEEDMDMIEQYWLTEHHRMEFSALRQYLSQLDPNTLHQVGIAIPGNYVERAPAERKTDLPWRDKDEDAKDINRDALDLLNTQILEMQDKVYEAATLSVQQMYKNHQGVRDTATRAGIYSRGQTVLSTAAGSRPFTGAIPGKTLEDEIHIDTPHVPLKYYSKEIPPPRPLPNTRVNRTKIFPQPIMSFVEPDPDNRLAPNRFIDQRNLLSDTKLVIYKPPRRVKTVKKTGISQLIQSSPEVLSDLDSVRSTPKVRQRSQLSMRGAANLIKSATMMQRLSSGSHANVVRFNENEVTTLHPNSLKWKRVEELCQGELKSPYEETRKDAAKQLGLLECGDPVVFYALKTAIVEDQNERVQYEAMKSLTHLGCLEAEILQMLLDYLIVGNEEVRIDMLKTLCDAKNVMFMDKANNVYPELLKVLGQFCKETNPHDEVSFQAAITFGRICTKNEGAVAKMYSYLEHGTDTHKKYAALTYLVRQFNETSWELATRVLEQLVNSPVWEYRRDSAQLLQHLGRRNLCQTEETEEKVYNVLNERLWDDSTEIVRLECAKTLVTLDLYPRAADDVIKRLSDPVSTVRAHAVISLATLGIKQTKVMRFLAEMLELDQSNAVRKEIIKAFATLGVTDRNILKILRDKERGEGVLAVEARKAIKQIEMIAAV